MSFSFNLTKTLNDGNQFRITEAAAPNLMNLSVKIGANPVQTVVLTPAEAEDIRTLLSYLTRSRMVETA